MLIDSHCHLNHNRLLSVGGPEAVTARAAEAGIGGMVSICCRIAEEFEELRGLAARFPNVWYSVGTHPHDAGSPAEAAISEDELVRLATSDSKIIGIGETGLDYFYQHSPVDAQQASFRKHIRACIETGLPLIVHARDADEDVMRIIREEGTGTNLTGVLHCFSSGPKMGEDALDFGFYISLSGIVTFKKSTELQDFVRSVVPADRILVETDAPYLAPEPERRKTNESALLVHTANYVASLKGISEEQLATTTTENFFRLFGKASRPW